MKRPKIREKISAAKEKRGRIIGRARRALKPTRRVEHVARSAVITATGSAIMLASLHGANPQASIPRREPAPIVRQVSSIPQATIKGKQLKQQKVTPRIRKQKRPESKHKLLVYYPGLSGKKLAAYYDVKYTTSWRFKPSKELLHDIKVIIVEECAKYNRKSDFNPAGIMLVNPYQVYTTFYKESRFNPNAIGPNKKDPEKGIGQLKRATIDFLANLPEMPVKVTDPFDLRQGIAGTVRLYAENHRKLPPGFKTTFRKYVAHNQGLTSAKNLKSRKGYSYANDSWKKQQEFKRKKVLEGYV